MNIFYLDSHPYTAAKYMCDKHVVKMVLESTQLISTAIHETGTPCGLQLLKPTHKNHPSAVWARASHQHFHWLCTHAFSLSLEYTDRYKKVHAYDKLLQDVLSLILAKFLILKAPSSGFVEPPQCMPDQYKVPGDAVTAYRNYYIGDKARFAKWKLGAPAWWPK